MIDRNGQRRKNERVAFEMGYRTTPEGGVVGLNGRLRALQYKRDGYARFTVRYSQDSTFTTAVHRLVALELYGEALYAEGIEVRHRDGNSLNNRHNNILLGTRSDNAMDKTPETRLRQARTASAKLHSLTNEQVLNLVADRRAGASYKDLCQKYGICKSLVSYIMSGRTYSHITGITAARREQ